MRTKSLSCGILCVFLITPAWACDMGSLFGVIVFALAIGALFCSLLSALLSWGMRPAPLAFPVPSLLLALVLGTTLGAAAGMMTGASNMEVEAILWATALASAASSMAVVGLAPAPPQASVTPAEPSVNLSPPAKSDPFDDTSQWKTIS